MDPGLELQINPEVYGSEEIDQADLGAWVRDCRLLDAA